ncbi:Aldo/keto reductase [Cantharellus anzutake]|uniref:Aldo/keto reductase n=1 Tax=Cantharellus anzutake TaxID=1750568 RepID=UPI0019036857|nr:Aldo/keto reductase [Cantharellus anzutake]KAF8313302.1 Aldo/keto reductase [Cantharellus anzutake]
MITLKGPLTVPRVWVGLWQLAGPAWGTAPASKVRAEMNRHLEQGFTTFGKSCHLADHYGSSEMIFGQFRKSRLATSQTLPIGATKWCIFKSPTSPYTRKQVEDAIRERISRMKSDRLDLLQIHWQDYDDLTYIETLQHIVDIKREGRIRIDALGLVNFDARRVDEICEFLGEGEIITNQVQFSLVDTRPLHGMAVVCAKHRVKLLTYGTLCGGFLSDRWLEQPQPDPYFDPLTPSQRKVFIITNSYHRSRNVSQPVLQVSRCHSGAWGGWDLFQSLLCVLRVIGDRHGGLSISNVATRWVLDHPFVAAVIIGVRLGVAEHKDDNSRVFGFRLSPKDRADIEEVLDRSNGHNLIHTIGDCGSEYR